MKLADVCIRRPVFAVMLIGGLAVLGLVSIPRLGLDLFPGRAQLGQVLQPDRPSRARASRGPVAPNGPAVDKHQVDTGRRRLGRREAGPVDQCCDHTDAAEPLIRRVVDRDVDFQIKAAAPALEFLEIQQLFRTAAAIEYDDAPVATTVLEQVIDHGAQRRKTDTARDDDNVGTFRSGHRPGRTERAAYAYGIAFAEVTQSASHCADGAYRMRNRSRLRGIAAHGDRAHSRDGITSE